MEREGLPFAELKSKLLDAVEELSFGVAEEVDGLHGIADDEDGAACGIGPRFDERGDEFVLTPAGVLELVDKEVMDIVADGLGGVGGEIVFAAQNTAGDLSDLNEVDGAGFCEYCFQFCRGVAEKEKARANDLPVFFGVASGREIADVGESFVKTGDIGELVDEVFEAKLLVAMLSRESETDVDLLAEFAVIVEEQAGEAEAGSASVFESLAVFAGAAGEIGSLGEIFELDCAMLACELRKLVGFLCSAGDFVEELFETVEGGTNGVAEGTLEMLAEGLPVFLTAEDEVEHPAVALAEHSDEEVFEFLPAIISPEKESPDGVAEIGMSGIPESMKGGAGGVAIEFCGTFVDLEVVAEAGMDGLLDGEIATEGVDGGDAELRGELQEAPVALLGVPERACGESLYG
jgi:hypothetical protein